RRCVSQFQNIRRLSQTTSAIKRSAFGSRPENNRVGTLSATPGKRFLQQFFSKSLTPHFRDNIKVGYVSMKLGFVLNRIRKFLKQLHANMSDQFLPVVENPATPRTRAGKNVFLHPGCTSANKKRFRFRCGSGFSTKLITQFSQRRTIS